MFRQNGISEREVQIDDFLTGTVDHLMTFDANEFEVRAKPFNDIGGKRSEKLVRVVHYLARTRSPMYSNHNLFRLDLAQ